MKTLSRSGPLARFFSLLVVVVSLAACASIPGGERTLTLRPGPQRLPTLRAQGDLVIATLPGATVTVEPLTAKGLDVYYARRATLLNPFNLFSTRAKGLLAFVVRIHNVGRERIHFDPGQTALVDQKDRRSTALGYDELYSLFSELHASTTALRALQDTVLTNLLVVPPKLDREGLLFFPAPDPDVKTAILEVGSFYIGSAEQLLLFEFEVKHPS
ncbi:MAG: hypothetical protein C3F12_12870 [Candidatus Methylomirabilota bacterium]|nr:hypothetical protein [Candidatus Methylomirabilis sp.]NJD67602.1 hypothetical protein [candidate division NC10 bacterium]PWB42807.1 MAG: hypothetical protein C3F12_12870 [candidate division NC10 bacterium]